VDANGGLNSANVNMPSCNAPASLGNVNKRISHEQVAVANGTGPMSDGSAAFRREGDARSFTAGYFSN
jgi:hypothetical protein